MSKAVILIPGIKGTKLYDSNTFENDVLWEDVTDIISMTLNVWKANTKARRAYSLF